MPPRIQIVFLIGALGSGFYLYFQETMPVTGRRRFNVVSPELEKKLVEGQFEDLLQSLGNRILPPDHPYTQQVQRVMRRLVPVSGLEKEKWEVCVIDDPDEKNAFVLPRYVIENSPLSPWTGSILQFRYLSLSHNSF